MLKLCNFEERQNMKNGQSSRIICQICMCRGKPIAKRPYRSN